jgi:hypothetical protein
MCVALIDTRLGLDDITTVRVYSRNPDSALLPAARTWLSTAPASSRPLEYLVGGMTEDQILEDFPSLTRDIRAVCGAARIRQASPSTLLGDKRGLPARHDYCRRWWLLGAAVVIAIHWRRQWREAARLKLGREGERAVAEYLNIRLDADSRVLHGVPPEGWHCRSRPHLHAWRLRYRNKGSIPSPPRRPVVHFAGTGVRINGFRPDRDPNSPHPALRGRLEPATAGTRDSQDRGERYRRVPVV